MRDLGLTPQEQDLLQGYFRTSSIPLLRLKAQAMLMCQQQLSVGQMEVLLGRDERTLRRWMGDFSCRRMASLFSGYQDNEHAGKLTREQKAQVAQVLQQPPSAYGLPKAFWDVPQLRDYIEATFGVVYESVQAYHFLLRFSRLSFKYPDTQPIRRNEAQVQATMEAIRAEIAPYLQDPTWEVFASDETRLQLEALTRRAWLKKGERTVLKVERSHEAQNYLGFLNQKTFACDLYPIAWGRQTEILEALYAHLDRYPDKRICIVWDNASCHKGALLREQLRASGRLSRVHLVALPPYAPDQNPIEKVWNVAKQRIANQQYPSFAQTKEAFEQAVASQPFPYPL